MKYIYIANWKMNLSFTQSIDFCEDNFILLQELSNNATVVLCPSFVALASLATKLKNSSIAIGAQNCSEYETGAYTGEVSALSLAQVGTAYCIVGHSEQRMYHNETTEKIIKKIKLLYHYNINPVLCIGETYDDLINNQTHTVLANQLTPILIAIAQEKNDKKNIIVAYEPLWSIGTGMIPEPQQLVTIFAYLAQLIPTILPDYSVQLLYGGSVQKNNSVTLKKNPYINGFLIGNASINFKEFSAIIIN
ncbi:MAG TPA: triose-phosphate isomerase [Candidatus Babeliales bacterium]|nr:triose-phosphate isomerase [Candidatus Babeliales bacterium]